MSWWTTSTGESAVSNETNFVDENKGFGEPIPEGSYVLAMIDKAQWKNARDSDSQSVNVQWTVLKPEQFANRKVWQNLWIRDAEPFLAAKGETQKAAERRDRDLKKLSVIDNNARKKLRECPDYPDDTALATLNNAMMVISLGVINGNNFVRDVMEKSHELKVGVAKSEPAKSSGNTSRDLDDEIPF